MRTPRLATLMLIALLGGTGCGESTDDTVREAATAFGLAYLNADGEAACERMTPKLQDEFVTSLNDTLDQLAETPTGRTPRDLPDCPAAMTLVSSIDVGRAGPSDNPVPAQEAAEANIEVLEAEDGVGDIDVEGDRAEVATVAGQEGSLTFQQIEDEWLVDQVDEN